MKSTLEHNSGKAFPMLTEHDLGKVLKLAADVLVGAQQARQRLDGVLTYWDEYDMAGVFEELQEISDRLNSVFSLQKP